MRRRFPLAFGLGLLLALICTLPRGAFADADAEGDSGTDTVIVVRVISKGAKFVGTSMGGARVLLRDAQTGEMLASGVTRGSTGNTGRIMGAAPRQGDVMATPDAASFRTTLNLEKPRLVKVTAAGPVAQPQASTTVSQTQWVVPGRDITGGDAWLLELRGLVVDVLEPPAHMKTEGTPQKLHLAANVTMMCGCPIAPDKPWKPQEFEVKAILRRNGERQRTVPMEHAGAPSQFETTVEVDKAGAYQVTVYAHQPANGNTGLDHTTFVVAE